MKTLGLLVLVSLFVMGIQQIGGGSQSYREYSVNFGSHIRLSSYRLPRTTLERFIDLVKLLMGIICLFSWILYYAPKNDERGYHEQQINQSLLRQISDLPPSELSDEEIRVKIDELIIPKWKMTVFLKCGILYCEQFQIKAKWANKKSLRAISIRSSDMIGAWRGEGYISVYSGGTIFSMMKHYDDKEKAGQTGIWANLQYEGELSDDGKIIGEWFYKGFKGSEQYSGKFEMAKVQNETEHNHAE